MQILISKNIRITGAPGNVKAAITKALTMDNPAYVQRKKKRQPTYGIDKRLQLYVYDQGALVIPRGFAEELFNTLEYLKFTQWSCATDYTEGNVVDFGPWNSDYEPFKDQQEALEKLLALGNGILVAPAGSGKTLMGMNYIANKARPALWLTHTQDLLYQSKAAAEKYLHGVGEVGILGDGKVIWGSGKLIVATVQTLQANPQLIEALNQFIGTVVIDEAHHFPAPAFIEVAGQFKAKNMLGVTATPDRKDYLEVYMYTGIGPKLYQIDRQTLYDTGRLIKPEVKFVYTDFNYELASDRNEIDAVDAGGEELDYTDLTRKLISDEERLELLARSILESSFNNYSIVITESVRYCYAIRDKVQEIFDRELSAYPPSMSVIHGPISRYTWRAAGTQGNAMRLTEAGDAIDYRKHKSYGWQVKVAQYTEEEYEAWNITSKKRKEIMTAAKNKQIDILFATQLAREGLDMQHLTVGHLAMPKRGDAGGKKNGASVEQEIGRIMRADPLNPNKRAIWYDYVDYNVGVYQSQYQSRRSVYRRLGVRLPKKPRTKKDDIVDFLSGNEIFKGGLPY